LLIEEFNHWFQEATKLKERVKDGFDTLWKTLRFIEKLFPSIYENRSVIFYKTEDSSSESRIKFLKEQKDDLKKFMDRSDPEVKEY
jgi:hypothetical protein